MTINIFSIDGYFLDEPEDRFYNYKVTDTHDIIDEELDEDIFFYGLSEETIKKCIENKEPVCNEFMITSYTKAGIVKEMKEND